MHAMSLESVWSIGLAGEAWLEYRPVNQKLTGVMSRRGTQLGCGCGPWAGCTGEERQQISVSSHVHVALPLSLSLPSPLGKISKYVLR